MKTVSRNVNRTDLLALLQSVSYGLSSRDILEQSSCFVFNKGEVMTYNDEVACRAKTELKLKGAVQAKPLLAILEKLPDDTIELQTKKGALIIVGKRRHASIRMEREVLLPIKHVETPGKFKRLHKNFIDAVNIAKECTGKDAQKFWTVCVHIHPKWIEACDGVQIARYKLQTGVKRSTLVRSTAIKCISELDVLKYNETPTWLHFKNKEGLVVSCRRYMDDYPMNTMTRLIKFSGTRTALPKVLGDAAERAGIFSSENADNDMVEVLLKSGLITVKGEGVSGYFVERKKLRYKGPELMFFIAPKLLQELTRRHNECEITEDRLKVNGGNFVYVSSLGKAGDSDEQEDEEQDDEDSGDDEGEDED
jgi:DNA polymerase III sliding clamp (beta) subunit (PCNA family)